MEHVVFYPASDGAPAFRRLANLEEAVRLVEHLRNVEGVSSVSVHALSEVPLAFRTYYRVEVPSAGEPVASSPALGLAPEPVVAEPLQVAEPVAVVEPLQVAEPLSVVEPLHLAEPSRIDVPAQAEAPEQQEESAALDADDEPAESADSEPAFVIANGRGGPASLGFFA